MSSSYTDNKINIWDRVEEAEKQIAEGKLYLSPNLVVNENIMIDNSTPINCEFNKKINNFPCLLNYAVPNWCKCGADDEFEKKKKIISKLNNETINIKINRVSKPITLNLVELIVYCKRNKISIPLSEYNLKNTELLKKKINYSLKNLEEYLYI